MFLHGGNSRMTFFFLLGLVHILFNFSFQLRTGIQMERDYGSLRIAIIYFCSGIGGFIFGSNLSDIRVLSVGCSGALCKSKRVIILLLLLFLLLDGMIACMLLELIKNWSMLTNPVRNHR